MQIFVVGLAKKVLLANNIGKLWDTILALPAGELTTAGAWLGVAAFAFQLYFDFSGYSDMAVGLGRMLGFESAQLQLPLYRQVGHRVLAAVAHLPRHLVPGVPLYPLRGNWVSKPRLFFNLLVVWAATGIWHGASWNFLIWGLYFAVLLILEKAFLGKLLQKLPAALQHLYTLFLVLVSWAIFAVEDFGHMGAYLKAMFGLGGGLTNDNVSYYFFSFLPRLSSPLWPPPRWPPSCGSACPKSPGWRSSPFCCWQGWSSPPPTWWTPPTTPSSTSDSDSGGKP